MLLFISCFVHFMLVVSYPILYVIGMDHVDLRRGDNLVMHASVRREHWQTTKGIVPVPRCRGGRARRADADNESQPQAGP